ncbi:hypothetical protein ACJJTC_018395 [Scirpophaga incertulas]
MDRNQCVKLITLYSEHRYLWDPHDPNYVNRVLREQAWMKISEELDLSVVELKKKLESLLGSYRREKSREKRSAGTGFRAYKSRWYAYKYFNFMPRSKAARVKLDNGSQEDTNDTKPLKFENETPVDTRVKQHKTAGSPMPFYQKHKRARMNSQGEDSDTTISKALRLLQQCAEASTPKDHYTTFGNYVSNELRKYDSITLAHVKNAICGIIFQADTGKFRHFQNTVEPDEHGNSIRPDSSSNNSSPAGSPRRVFEVKVPQSPMTSQPCSSQSLDVAIDGPSTSQTYFVKSEVDEEF